MNAIAGWALRHHVSQEAMAELMAMVGAGSEAAPVPHHLRGKGEAAVQSLTRLEATGAGGRLWRNNVGVLKDERGVPVRFGLANDSAQLNAKLKSSDLIGWQRVKIEPHHVGTVIAQFKARECKGPGWRWTGTDREVAQWNWLTLVQADGGDATFTTGPGSL